MAIQRLIGTSLDAIFRGTDRRPAYRVLLFDPYQDTMSNVVLDRYTQVPLDITPYVSDMSITLSHDTEANQCTITIADAGELDYRLFMFAFIKVYEGDLRVDHGVWPCVFTGLMRGQPSRQNVRGDLHVYQHTAFDRSVLYRDRTTTSYDAWNPEDDENNLGEICVALATDLTWGMALDRQEVLFGKFYRKYVPHSSTGSSAGNAHSEWMINKKLQIVDVPPMEALTNIMQPAQMVPAFNGEGKLVARPYNVDRSPIRIYSNNDLISSLAIPQNTLDLPTSVTVTGLDYRLTRLDYTEQRLITIGPITIGFFSPVIHTIQVYSEDRHLRAVPTTGVRNIDIQGPLLAVIFGFDDDYSINALRVDDFSCGITIRFNGILVAILVVTVSLALYITLRIILDELGETLPVLAFGLDIAATILLFLVLQTMTSIGTIQFDVWGTPFEYVYQELEAKALLSDTLPQEEKPKDIRNLIIGTLEDCEDLAKDTLQREVALTAQRTITMASDPLLEPNDVIELVEEGEVARYYVLEITRSLTRGSDPTMTVTAFRVK